MEADETKLRYNRQAVIDHWLHMRQIGWSEETLTRWRDDFQKRLQKERNHMAELWELHLSVLNELLTHAS